MGIRVPAGGAGRRAALLVTAVALLAAVAFAGCQKMPADQRLQRFLRVYQGLSPAQQQAALREVVLAEGHQRSRPGRDDKLELLFRDYQKLPAAQREAVLRAAAARPGGDAYAEYGLGNVYYASAGDSAAAGKRAEGAAVALLDSSRTRFERAVALDSMLVEAYVNLGSVYDDLSTHTTLRDRIRQQIDQQSAEKAYKRAVALRPADEKAHCNLGALYERLHRDREALAQFQAVLQQNPQSALAHYNLAIMFAEAKVYREAVAEWRAAAAADPHGDIGRRSRQNVKVVEQMMTTPVPANLGEPTPAQR